MSNGMRASDYSDMTMDAVEAPQKLSPLVVIPRTYVDRLDVLAKEVKYSTVPTQLGVAIVDLLDNVEAYTPLSNHNTPKDDGWFKVFDRDMQVYVDIRDNKVDMTLDELKERLA